MTGALLLVLVACRPARFTPEGVAARSLRALDGDMDGRIEASEIPPNEPDADRDGNGEVTPAELLAVLEADPWSFHPLALEAPIVPDPEVRPDRDLARDGDHRTQVAVRDLLRLLRREVKARAPTVPLPSDEAIRAAAGTGRLDSVPSREALALLRAGAAEAEVTIPPLPGEATSSPAP
jgi:hypothetical protein